MQFAASRFSGSLKQPASFLSICVTHSHLFNPRHQSRPHAVIDCCTYQSEALNQRWQAWSRPPAAWRRWAKATQWFLSGHNNKNSFKIHYNLIGWAAFDATVRDCKINYIWMHLKLLFLLVMIFKGVEFSRDAMTCPYQYIQPLLNCP